MDPGEYLDSRARGCYAAAWQRARADNLDGIIGRLEACLQDIWMPSHRGEGTNGAD